MGQIPRKRWMCGSVSASRQERGQAESSSPTFTIEVVLSGSQTTTKIVILLGPTMNGVSQTRYLVRISLCALLLLRIHKLLECLVNLTLELLDLGVGPWR